MEEFNPFSLIDKTILVTGASSGIGQGIAITCSKMGASVIISGRNKVKLQGTLSEMVGDNNKIITADLTKIEEIDKLVDQIPRLDGIVYSVGMGSRILCKNITEEDLDSIMNVNFKAPVMLQTSILKKKKINRKASIVFIDSIASDTPSYANSLYSASKGAILSYSKCLALELAPRLIRVNCISPAMVWTSLILKGGITEEELQEDEKNYPLKRYGKPEDVANLAIYLLSDASSWMTMSNVKITGGVISNIKGL